MDPRIARLASQNIYLGTSSWKYPGWRDLIYRRDYASDKAFENTALEEYSEQYSAVGVDHTYYSWPTPATFERYTNQVDSNFRFCLKATSISTVYQYPKIKRYGRLAGQRNPDFLVPETFVHNFVEPLRPFWNFMGPVILEFSPFRSEMGIRGAEWLERLDRFLSEIRSQSPLHYSVELRNANWLRDEYFALLKKHQCGHVHNSWTHMPAIAEQFARATPYDLPHRVVRLLLQPGTRYAEAVEAFAPYNRLIEESPILRTQAAQLIRDSVRTKRPSFVFVNNRFEGCAPKTIEGILEELERMG